MGIRVISFTGAGMELSLRIREAFTEEDIRLYTKCSFGEEGGLPSQKAEGKEDLYSRTAEEKENLQSSGKDSWQKEGSDKAEIEFVRERIGEWTKKQMVERQSLFFIGATGIAVRAIAPCLVNKLQDSPVLVLDERGKFVIPLLSGHVGGANELAHWLAERIGALPVITTATDLNGKFAVDLFAKKNGLQIINKEGIAAVSSRVLTGKEITISLEPGHLDPETKIPEGVRLISYPPAEPADVIISSEKNQFSSLLFLKPREYSIGIGCKRGKEPEKIAALIEKALLSAGILEEQIFSLASIDRKKDEEGLLAWSRKAGIPFFTYTAGQLSQVEGEFSASSFVNEQVGTDNVCERAAVRACGEGGRLVVGKQAEEGMTIAIAKREWRVRFDEK